MSDLKFIILSASFPIGVVVLGYLLANFNLKKAVKPLILPVYIWLRESVDKIKYFIAMKRGKPYFGHYLSAKQGGFGILKDDMKSLLKREMKEGFKLLEIGTWAGQSTRMWAETLGDKGIVYAIDNFKAAENSPEDMKEAGRTGKIRELYYHNIKGLNNIKTLEGNSDDILPTLKQEFDMIYIDGDHAYSQFKRDLENSLKILKKGGIICGDDLEDTGEIDRNYAWKNREKDYIYNPKTGKGYHPGIKLASEEILGKVEQAQMFWWKRIDGDENPNQA